ncbi:MAG: hypothetical protein K0U12_02715 [Gammaproteobacteria bacterium]|nr:hypothetical protein [Gammaproteobacteria bacterium]
MLANNKSSAPKLKAHQVLLLLKSLRRQLAWLLAGGLLLVFIVGAGQLSRTAQLALLICYALFAAVWIIWRVHRLKHYWQQQQSRESSYE